MRLAIVIPAYNEELCIREVILDFHRHQPDAWIYVIDNNSNDKTRLIAEATLKEAAVSGGVFFVAKQGKAAAIRHAFLVIDADVYLMVDADTTYQGADSSKVLQPILEGAADMTVGDRISGGDYRRENPRPFHNFGNSLVRRFINALFGSDLKDILSGYRGFSRLFVKNFPVMSNGFDLETEMTIHALSAGFVISEPSVEYSNRPAGSFSKLNTLHDGAKVLFRIASLFVRNRPFIAFSLLASFFLVTMIGLGLSPLIEFVTLGRVEKIPSLIVSSGMGILSLLLFAVGLLLEGIKNQHLFDYQHRLLLFKDLDSRFQRSSRTERQAL